MQYVTDDMDELFRRAAEDYPLDTSGSDWNKVHDAMQHTEGKTARPQNDKKKLLWLMLLAPFVLICNPSVRDHRLKSDTLSSGKTQDKGSKQPAAGIETQFLENTGKASFERHPYQSSASPDAAKVNPGVASSFRKKNARPGTGQFLAAPGFMPDTRQSTADVPGDIKGSKVVAALDEGGHTQAGPSALHKYALLPSPVYQTLSFIPPRARTRNIVSPASKLPQPVLREKGFYAGLMAGIDATTIRFQKVEGLGTDIGLLIGYQLNNRWAIETGAFVDRKAYYTAGKHFRPGSLYMPPGSKISEVTGECRMIEVPLTVKYNLSRTGRLSWFSTGGMSSYFMTKENYGYLYYYPASGSQYLYKSSYDNKVRDLFAIVHLSGGFSYKLGQLGSLRVEPYLKLPVAGVGSRNLKLTSTGIHIGITRKLY
ncbi:MAG TPA: hypothetical protein VFR58_09665 [Flavisolibacter sp.]|nr:hypothetical protein [Flavisolibacter sp.]